MILSLVLQGVSSHIIESSVSPSALWTLEPGHSLGGRPGCCGGWSSTPGRHPQCQEHPQCDAPRHGPVV